MAEQEAQRTEGQTQVKGKRSKLPIILAGFLLIAGAGGFMGWSHLKSSGSTSAEEKKAKPAGPPPVVDLKPFVVNLVDEGDVPRFIRVNFSLELRPGSNLEEIEQKTAEIRDAIIVLLSSKTSRELFTIEGKDRLRDEILTRVNSRLHYATVSRVFFKEFIIQ